MRTRIAVQPLPYQYGIEARALESLWELFGLARKAMKDHPGCETFARITTNMLNVHVRPVTSKWHRAHMAGVLDSRDGANEFRAELVQLQKKLVVFVADLQRMAYGTYQPDDVAGPIVSEDEISDCFKPVRYGLTASSIFPIENAAAINASEEHEIASRRRHYGIQVNPRHDAVGLALSGGGIRSATFCLGVIQVLTDRGLLQDVDYMSTVSGGGYTGSFITSRVGGGANLSSMGQPFGPDTDAVRHLRQNAKYLAAKDIFGQWTMVAGTFAGLLLNLSGPLAILCALAAFTAGRFDAAWLRVGAQICASVALAILLAYALVLQRETAARWMKGLFSVALGSSAVALLSYWLSLAVGGFSTLTWSPRMAAVFILVVTVVPGVAVALLRLPSVSTARRATSKALLLTAGCLVPLLALVTLHSLLHLATLPADGNAAALVPLRYVSGHTILILSSIVLGVVSILFVDVNHTGVHRLYRDQLAKTFVNGSAGASPLPLQDVNTQAAAPYHLINATVNLPSSESRVLRDRRSDFFLLSKHWIGSPSTGYVATSNWKAGKAPLDLATAMAISGAAASPQMGLFSKRSLAPLLSLLNVRLNYWQKHPTRGCTTKPGFLCLLREMFGACMSEKSTWFNLSDGGHIENMGVYELLRRRCKFIICVDGEADPKFMFAGQMTLVRHAQIDFGIRLEPRLDEIRFNPESGVSRSHIHLLRVHYPAGPGHDAATGLMLYLKLSVTGDETELLKRYRMLYPEFPHQSTVNQFYDEEQFEAYRQLGVHVAEGAFSPALLTSGVRPANVRAWFRDLAASMLEPSRP
jgi:hypothetical protein